MALPLPDPQLPGNPQDALQSIQRNFEAIAQTLAPPVPTGTVLPYAAATAPDGYLICNGGEVAVKDYPALDALLGTTYGARTNGSGGSGTSHFRLPDLRGRVVVSKGTHGTVNALGAGDTTSVNQRRPGHAHTGTALSGGTHSHSGTTNGSGDLSYGYYDNTTSPNMAYNFRRDASAQGVAGYSQTDNYRVMTGLNHTHSFGTSEHSGHEHSVSVGSTGGTTDAPSYIVLNHIIKA